MECRFRDKTILLSMNELHNRDGEIKRHIKDCSSCRDTYLLVLKINKIHIKLSPGYKIEQNILDYAKKKIEVEVNVFRNIIVSFSFSIASLLVFVIPVKNKIYTYDDFDNRISSIENYIVGVSDYMNLDVFDF